MVSLAWHPINLQRVFLLPKKQLNILLFLMRFFHMGIVSHTGLLVALVAKPLHYPQLRKSHFFIPKKGLATMNSKKVNVTKKSKKVKPLPFHEAIHVALTRKMSELSGRAKAASVAKFEYRVKSFLSHEYNPSLGLVGSINSYLNRLKLAGKSASYIRGMKSVLNGFMACLPTCQISMFSGVTR